ncbi:hypothetical protein JCM3766R1_006247 [Sporobolomyces carnicolor]
MSSLPPEFQRVVRILSVNRAVLIAAYALYYWDLLALFPLEYTHIWKSKRTPTKILYLLNRYVTLFIGFANGYLTLNFIPAASCKRIPMVQPLFSTTIIALCGCISTLRVYTIWNRDKRILALLSTTLVCCVTVMVYFSTQQQALLLPVFLTEPAGFTNCLSTRTDSKADNEIILWTMPLVFDSLVLTLTIARYFRMRSRTGGMEIPILRKIVNKHISYFAMITTLNVINVAFFSQPDPTLKPSNAVLTLTLTSMMSARLVLSLFAPASLPLVRASRVTPGRAVEVNGSGAG